MGGWAGAIARGKHGTPKSRGAASPHTPLCFGFVVVQDVEAVSWASVVTAAGASRRLGLCCADAVARAVCDGVTEVCCTETGGVSDPNQMLCGTPKHAVSESLLYR